MGMMDEFKEFAMKGNVVDLAVGVVIGGAFGAIVGSLVGDVLMPVVGVLTGGVDFSHMGFALKAAEGDKPAVMLAYGKFIQAIVNFLIVAFTIFMVIKQMNRLQKAPPPPPPAPPEPTAEEKLLTQIRDLLKAKG